MELEEADAAVYDNDSSKVLIGKMSGQYMAAYNNTKGFVGLVEDEQRGVGPPKFNTPTSDPVVVVAKCTRVMLDDRILDMARAISSDPRPGAALGTWKLPKLKWVNGVPGCGKTTHIVRNFDEEAEAVVTTTVEAAKDLKEKLAHRLGERVRKRVRTMASVLVNGFKEGIVINRLTVDEALMCHFGAIVMAARLSAAEEVTLIGDINQLPYIDRNNLFDLRYCRPNLTTNITSELSCTHRSPLDVAFAIAEVYDYIYSSNPIIHSLKRERFTGAQIPSSCADTLYLVHTQEEKRILMDQGYGTGASSRVLTIHEAQGQTRGHVIIVRIRGARIRIHESIPHAVVAVTRHTDTCVYYSDDGGDAIGNFISRAVGASAREILEHNLRMSMTSRDNTVMESLVKRLHSQDM